eukprot:scaffold206332_cov33-Tisochrysis_lutea.AAC.1
MEGWMGCLRSGACASVLPPAGSPPGPPSDSTLLSFALVCGMPASACCLPPLPRAKWRDVAALCGQHCLNNLLQGPYFSEISLAEIAQVRKISFAAIHQHMLSKQQPPRLFNVFDGCAHSILPHSCSVQLLTASRSSSQELDARERALMLSEGMTSDAMRFMAEASGNVALDGNFSIQVGRGGARASMPHTPFEGTWPCLSGNRAHLSRTCDLSGTFGGAASFTWPEPRRHAPC